jgi:hypothetical protein
VGNPTCAQRATLTFAQVLSATLSSGGGLSLVASAATLVCGGPDDYHYNVMSANESLTVVPGAVIQVLPITENMQLQTIPASQLSSYLATDNDTRIFEITGPLDAITRMQEQFHP